MLRLQVAGVLVRDGKVLLCLRSTTRSYYACVWDFPGGHIEPGETDHAALRRELAEELGIAVSGPARPPLAHIVDTALGFDLKLWVIHDWHGVPENRLPAEHETIAWFAPGQTSGLPLALPGYADLIGRAVASAS